MHNAVTIELNLDQKVYYREVYSLLDFLADVGGLLGALKPFFMGLILVLNYYSGYQFLMAELFVNRDDLPE